MNDKYDLLFAVFAKHTNIFRKILQLMKSTALANRRIGLARLTNFRKY